jgi:hypothetical protein
MTRTSVTPDEAQQRQKHEVHDRTAHEHFRDRVRRYEHVVKVEAEESVEHCQFQTDS